MVSDVFQLMMARIGAEQKSLVGPLVHNAETIVALKAARRSDLVSHDGV